MSESVSSTPEETFVERVKSARRSAAVFKAKLITLRSDLPDGTILAFEGDDDKIIYGQWIRRIRPGFRYEPFPCGGKREVRALKNSLARDLSGLGYRVYFLVDRDFDDLSGFQSIENVFMTDMYSVENYLVCRDVLEEILRDEFPCHAMPEKRRELVELFEHDYKRFLELTYGVNERIFIGKQIPIDFVKRLPTKLRELARIEVGNIEPAEVLPESVVVYAREPTIRETHGLRERFASLHAATRYRGKFALKFFREWLNKLVDDHGRDDTTLFAGVKGSVRRAELVVSNFASKSPMPAGLEVFVETLK